MSRQVLLVLLLLLPALVHLPSFHIIQHDVVLFVVQLWLLLLPLLLLLSRPPSFGSSSVDAACRGAK
jgi:hypothetical protein